MPTVSETVELHQAPSGAVASPVGPAEASTRQVPDERSEPPGKGAPVRPYDFRRPQHLSADQLRSMQRIHIAAAELIQNRLGRETGIPIRVHLKSIEELAFALVMEAIPEHTYASILDLSPLEEKGLLLVESRLCLGLVDRVLGGVGKSPDEDRPLTAIDQVALEKPIEILLQCLRQTWQEVCPMKMTTAGRRNNRQQAQVLPPGEPVLCATLEAQGEVTAGWVRLCLPVAALKGALETASERSRPVRANAERLASFHSALRTALERVPLPLTVLVGSVELPMRSLLALRPGDIVRLDQPADKPVQIRVGGKPAFLGRMGLSGRRKAVQIISRTDPTEEE